jgi:hypothetical protein
MALPFSDQVVSTTTNLLEEFAEDNIYGDAPLFYHLKETGQVLRRGGADIQVDLMYQKIAAGGSYTRYDNLNVQPTDTDTALKAAWKLYYTHVILSRHEMLLNSGESAKVSLIESKTRNAHLKMADMLSTDLFGTGGDSATGLTGLRNLGSTSTTHHNISPTDFTNWVADVDATSTNLSLSRMEQAYIDATIGSDMPDILVTNKIMYKKYWALLTNLQRYGEGATASGGFKYLLFNGVPIFFDSHSPGTSTSTNDNWMFFLNSKHLFLYVHEDDNMTVSKLPTPINQDIHVQRLTFTGNLLCTNRRMVSVLSKIKPS